jgi:hypothetical protein
VSAQEWHNITVARELERALGGGAGAGKALDQEGNALGIKMENPHQVEEEQVEGNEEEEEEECGRKILGLPHNQPSGARSSGHSIRGGKEVAKHERIRKKIVRAKQRCPEAGCDKRTVTKTGMAGHMRLEHEGAKLACLVAGCQQRFNWPKQRRIHVEKSHQ